MGELGGKRRSLRVTTPPSWVQRMLGEDKNSPTKVKVEHQTSLQRHINLQSTT